MLWSNSRSMFSHNPSALNSSQLQDWHARFERIMDLQEEVARPRKESILRGTTWCLIK